PFAAQSPTSRRMMTSHRTLLSPIGKTESLGDSRCYRTRRGLRRALATSGLRCTTARFDQQPDFVRFVAFGTDIADWLAVVARDAALLAHAGQPTGGFGKCRCFRKLIFSLRPAAHRSRPAPPSRRGEPFRIARPVDRR